MPFRGFEEIKIDAINVKEQENNKKNLIKFISKYFQN
jgi:hypothetical protein